GYLSLDHLQALVRSPCLPQLSQLELRQCTAGDEGCRAIVESGVLARLTELDLTHGEVTDAGAALLTDCTDLLHLQRLVLAGTRPAPRGVALLEELGLFEVRLHDQRQWGQARGYLRNGDYE